jgi:hypothetical protein
MKDKPLTPEQLKNLDKLPKKIIQREAILWGLQDTKRMTRIEMVEYIRHCLKTAGVKI